MNPRTSSSIASRCNVSKRNTRTFTEPKIHRDIFEFIKIIELAATITVQPKNLPLRSPNVPGRGHVKLWLAIGLSVSEAAALLTNPVRGTLKLGLIGTCQRGAEN
jgi:hypothetical protein